MKTCAKCGATKPRDQFHRRASAKDGLHPHCKECACAYSRKWAQDHPEQNRERSARWAERNREYYRQNARKWAQENPERKAEADRAYYLQNRQTIIDRATEWNREHPETFARRRARKAAAPFQIIAHPVAREASEDQCYWCGAVEGPFHLDHVLPLARGGPHCTENLVTACAPCNMAKKAKNPWRWIADLVAA